MTEQEIIDEFNHFLDTYGLRESYYRNAQRDHGESYAGSARRLTIGSFTWSEAIARDAKLGKPDINWSLHDVRWTEICEELRIGEANVTLPLKDQPEKEYNLEEILKHKPVDVSDMPEEIIPSNYKSR